MERIIVIGAGGHAKVVISSAIAAGFSIERVLDDAREKWGTEILGCKITGPLSQIDEIGSWGAVVAIGDNYTRKKIVNRYVHLEWKTVIHPGAHIHPSAHVGAGTVVFAGTVIQPDAFIGKHCIVNTGATVDHDCHLGDYVHVSPGVHLAGGVYLAEGSFLGIGSSVITGIEVGGWSTVGAGGVVIKDLPPYVVAIGTPARVIKHKNDK